MKCLSLSFCKWLWYSLILAYKGLSGQQRKSFALPLSRAEIALSLQLLYSLKGGNFKVVFPGFLYRKCSLRNAEEKQCLACLGSVTLCFGLFSGSHLGRYPPHWVPLQWCRSESGGGGARWFCAIISWQGTEQTGQCHQYNIYTISHRGTKQDLSRWAIRFPGTDTLAHAQRRHIHPSVSTSAHGWPHSPDPTLSKLHFCALKAPSLC